MQRPSESDEDLTTATVSLLSLRDLVATWQRQAGIDALTPEPGSRLAVDNRDTEPIQISHAASSSIGVAVDHMDCLLECVISGAGTDEVSLTTKPFALYSLLRGAIENAATAVWLLAPAERSDRVIRRIRLALQDAKHEDEVGVLMGREAERLPQRLAALAPMAEKAGFAMPPKGGTVAPSEIVRDAGASFDLGAKKALFAWRVCSGMAHGDSWALTALPTHEVMNDPASNVLDMRVTLDFSQLAGLAVRAVRVIEEARRLYATQRQATPA